ncbi:MAG: MBL fold metallo-hydrolase [Anaerolineae bacterium]|nr:MAG: MBL fold metallo-hydrolase [Anaerolineae bacterium]
MLQRERVSDNIYVFQSDLYAQVTAGLVVGDDWAVAIDTLAYPEETLEMREFAEKELGLKVKYVILTHYHADHSWGSCFFPGALVIAHQRCRELLATRGLESLKAARRGNTVFQNTKIVLPQITFEQGQMQLRVGKRLLTLFPLGGHSPDGIAVLCEDERILFAGDAMMSLPVIVDGDLEEARRSLKQLSEMGLENIVQGHGDVILRGEIEEAVQSNLDYLDAVVKAVRRTARKKYALDDLRQSNVEACGKDRVLLAGLAEQLHLKNLVAVYRQLYGREPLSAGD